ncbi:hypothetical protein QJQ45_023355 [Haematococcus lacustris]|nr:hypothetical protein QJQ45_023355 [Haematococcus lacustris]
MLARQGQPMQAFQPQAQQAVPTQLQPAQLFPMLQAPQNRTQASPTLALQGQPGTLAPTQQQPARLLHLFQAPQNQTQRPQTPSGTQLIQPQPLPSPRQPSTTSQSQSGKENKSTGGKIPERECQALTSTELSSPDVGFELRLEPVECASPHPEQPDILIVIDETLAVDVICHEHCAVEWQGPGPDSPTPSALGDEVMRRISDANVADAGTAGPAYASLSAPGTASRANAAAARSAVSDVAGPAESDAGVANVGTARPAWDFGTDAAAACAVATFVPRPAESDAAATDTQRHPANSTAASSIPTPTIHHLSVPIWQGEQEVETTCLTCGCSILPHWWAPLHKHSHDHEVFVFATSSVIISNFIFAQTLPILILIL